MRNSVLLLLVIFFGFHFCTSAQVVINEVMINAGNCDGSCVPNTGEWTELYNTSNSPIDISCFVLSDGDFAVTLPTGTILGPHAFYVIGSPSSAATIDLDIGSCNCTSVGSMGDGNIGVFTNSDEQLVIANNIGQILDGIYWGNGQFNQTSSISTSPTSGCPSVTINLSATNPLITALSGGGSDQNSVGMNCDGIGTWNNNINSPTPGSSNVNAIVFNDNPNIIPQSCGSLGSITLNPTGGVGPFSFSWLGALSGNSTNNVNSLTAGNYSVEITDQGQCVPPALFSINVPFVNTPSLSINTTNNNICLGQSVTLNASGGGNYVWSPSTSLNTTSGSIVIATPNATTTFSVQSNNNGCNETQSITIQVDSPPNVVINNNTPICEGDILNIGSSVFSGAIYNWTGPNGFSNNNANFSINNASSLHQGTYQLSLILGACSITASTNIVIDIPTSSTFTSPGPLCYGASPIDLIANNEPGTWSGAAIINSTSGIFNPSLANIGSNTVIFDSNDYCTSPTSLTITILDNADATITSIPSICSNDNDFNLIVAQSGGVWSGTGVDVNGVVSPSTLGAGIFDAVYTISGQCGDSDAISIEIYASPAPAVNSTAINGCSPLLGEFQNINPLPNENCIWMVDGSMVTGTCTGLNYLFSEAGCHDVTLMVNNAEGCNTDIHLDDIICVDQPPIAAFNWSPLIPTLSNNVVNFQNLSMNQTQQYWNINGFESSDFEIAYTVPYDVTESFLACLEVESPFGCKDSTCFTIAVDNEILIYVPNAFTPNNDDINNGFGPSIFGIESEDLQYELLIFNRFGDCIFRSKNPLERWDGNVHDGDYYGMSTLYEWQLKIGPKWDAEVKLLKGFVLLLR